jgi:cytochrome c oxidase assembly protein subunit 11
VKIGEEVLIFYRAKNLSDKPITGMALFNVIPFKMGEYFNKIECFCFTQQTLQPGEEVDMPVTFYIDPAMAKDKRLDEISEMTLSYSFFLSEDEDEE